MRAVLVIMVVGLCGCDLLGAIQSSIPEQRRQDDIPRTPSIVGGRGGDSTRPSQKRDTSKQQDTRTRSTSRKGTRKDPWWGPELEKVPAHRRGNQRIKTFTRAKKTLLYDVHKGHHTTFYCECRYDQKKSIDHRSCGYKVRKNPERARRVEYEHVVPASAMGRQLTSWSKGDAKCTHKSGRRYKGRRCAQRVSDEFRLIEADMYNLQPSVGEVNADRLHYPMGEIPGEARAYGKCDVEIRDGVVEPAPRIRGDIARTYLYMDWAYPSFDLLSREQVAQFQAWSKADPPDRWEKERARRIAQIQGNENPFVR